MKHLKDILYKTAIQQVSGSTNVQVSGITMDSRQVVPQGVFVAIKGTTVDGHLYINTAIEKGAVAIVCQEFPLDFDSYDCTFIQVAETAEALGVMASNFYDNPSRKLRLVGITGTNGKTTCVTLLYKLFTELGYNTGLLSTVENRINDQVVPSTHTTPDAVSLNALLANMVKQGCTHCFMEVSSHSIHQHRIAGLEFDGAAFTNITHDHLDYHKTFDEYIKAKKAFFDGLSKEAFALVNIDDKRGRVMLQNTKASKHEFALKTIGDFNAKIISNTIQGLELSVDGYDVWFRLIGEFNAYNLVLVYAIATLLQEDPQDVLTCLSSLTAVSGRFEIINSKEGVTAIVDYAHTPDALENVLETIQSLRLGESKIITVVGCGGDRDKAKRPVMADIACRLSEQVIFTSDNPRSESAEDIIADMMAGVKITQRKKVLTITDREQAIKAACQFAQPNDIILVAGKGHEDYQIISGVKHHFDDREQLKKEFDL